MAMLNKGALDNLLNADNRIKNEDTRILASIVTVEDAEKCE